MDYLSLFIDSFIEIFNEVSPYLLLGFFIAGLLHVFVSKDKILKYFGKKNFRSVLNAAILGVPLPLCSCGVIPTAMSIYKDGASKSATISFLISTPQTGVDSILISYSLIGLPFAILRPIIALITGVFGGVLMNLTTNENAQTNVFPNSKPEIKISEKKGNWFKVLFQYSFVEFLQDISNWLLLGLLIATLITVLLPNDFFANYVTNDFLGMVIILIAAIPLYVCATGSVPIAAALMLKGLSPGAALVFLMAGPATNAATITVIGKVLGKRTLFFYLFSIIAGALISGVIIDYALPASWFNYALIHEHNHSHSSGLILYVQYFSTIILTLLLINGYYIKYFKKPEVRSKKSEINNTIKMKNITINVKGMTCNHCKLNVETNIKKIDGISDAVVDLSKNEVNISGENIDLQKVKKVVDGLGYELELKN